jgi:hypothetical protein
MDQIFLYQQWLHQQLRDYVTSPRTHELRGRKITFSPSQYGSALMQAYLGRASLSWIAKYTRMPVQELQGWRREPQFLLVMDWSKSVFSKAFQKNLALNDYSIAQYHYIAAEISLLEESVRVTVRVPLYQHFKRLGRTLMSRHQNSLSLSKYDLRLFRRFFLFFLALEHHWPSTAHHRIKEDFLPLAKEVVWPLLDDKPWVGSALQSIQRTATLPQIRSELESKLSKTLQRFR